MPRVTRRRMLAGALSAPLLGLLARADRAALAAGGSIRLGPARPFGFDRLIAAAKALAAAPYAPPVVRAADVLERIDYDAYQRIRFRAGCTLWGEGGGPYPVRFFHLGRYFKAPVGIHVVIGDAAREVLYAPDCFMVPEGHAARALPDDIGFAGFRVMERDGRSDWVAFLGAAYFRSAGALDQYGMSARGVAIDTALPTPEEFPRFTDFWLTPSPSDPDAVVVHALLDGPSITGAFRMAMRKHGGVVMDVTAALFARADIARMGIAPLTSMFWYAESNRRQGSDWRPEIHDSDGLAIWTGGGERIWRPLNNPPSVQVNSFMDASPKGFGLLQRDRVFHNYQDDGAFYDRRPSVWVEPLGDWGEGALQLVEIPTGDEIHDNIVAYWVPKAPVKAGSAWSFDYRLHWVADEPYAPEVGHVVATRTGIGGVPGRPRTGTKRKFVVDFAGGPLEDARKSDAVEPVVSASRGTVDNRYALQIVGTRQWRAFFDLDAAGAQPVDLRLYLRLGDRTLTETWLYQHLPAA